MPSIAYAMGYGTLSMLAYLLLMKVPFCAFEQSFLLDRVCYLAIPGSTIAFLSYLSLLSRIRPESAGYATVFFPVVAMVISIFFENYRLIPTDFIGIGFIILGNCLVLLRKKQRLPQPPELLATDLSIARSIVSGAFIILNPR